MDSDGYKIHIQIRSMSKVTAISVCPGYWTRVHLASMIFMKDKFVIIPYRHDVLYRTNNLPISDVILKLFSFARVISLTGWRQVAALVKSRPIPFIPIHPRFADCSLHRWSIQEHSICIIYILSKKDKSL